jgi:hypothetical protein
MISRFHATILLIVWTTTSSLYAALIPATNRQTAVSQGDANKPPEPPKPTSRPNPDASGIYHPGDGVTVPKLIYSVEPEFSEKA